VCVLVCVLCVCELNRTTGQHHCQHHWPALLPPLDSTTGQRH
jgi:hypothetical protein